MGRRGFVISMDLIVAIGVVLVMIIMLAELSSYSWNRYSYVADALAVLQHQGVSADAGTMSSRLSTVLPSESYNFTLVDFGTLTPLNFCSNSTECDAAYPECVFYLCGKKQANVQTGEYQKYSSDPLKYCSLDMISKGSCKPEGDTAQRIYVDMGLDDLADHFYILRLEVAR